MKLLVNAEMTTPVLTLIDASAFCSDNDRCEFHRTVSELFCELSVIFLKCLTGGFFRLIYVQKKSLPDLQRQGVTEKG